MKAITIRRSVCNEGRRQKGKNIVTGGTLHVTGGMSGDLGKRRQTTLHYVQDLRQTTGTKAKGKREKGKNIVTGGTWHVTGGKEKG